jgi:hypothetical protein
MVCDSRLKLSKAYKTGEIGRVSFRSFVDKNNESRPNDDVFTLNSGLSLFRRFYERIV